MRLRIVPETTETHGTAPEADRAFNECRDLLREIGNGWLSIGLVTDPAERFNIARECERKAGELGDAFRRLAALIEEKENA
jgi:hypothetical protein